MTTLSTRTLRLTALPLAVAAAIVVALSAGNASPGLSGDARAPIAAEKQVSPEKQIASARFEDGAPFGVDPIVTGPVSESFEKRQEAAGCDRGEWPHIPTVCYPD